MASFARIASNQSFLRFIFKIKRLNMRPSCIHTKPTNHTYIQHFIDSFFCIFSLSICSLLLFSTLVRLSCVYMCWFVCGYTTYLWDYGGLWVGVLILSRWKLWFGIKKKHETESLKDTKDHITKADRFVKKLLLAIANEIIWRMCDTRARVSFVFSNALNTFLYTL